MPSRSGTAMPKILELYEGTKEAEIMDGLVGCYRPANYVKQLGAGGNSHLLLALCIVPLECTP